MSRVEGTSHRLVGGAAATEQGRNSAPNQVSWRSGHDDVGGVLVDPLSRRPRPWIDVMRDLVIHVRDSIEAWGDPERVEVGIQRLTRLGGGATGQRSTFAKTGQLLDVVVEAVRRTAGH